MKLKLLVFLWFCVGSLFAQDSTCVKIDKALTNYYSYFFSFDADYKQYFKPEKIVEQQIDELRYAVLNSENIHCSTMVFGFDPNGEVYNVILLDSEMPEIWYRKLMVTRDSLNRITKKVIAPIDTERMIDTIGQYSIKKYLYNTNGNLLKSIEEVRNWELSQTVRDFQYDAQNRIERIDYQFIGSQNEVREHFTYSYKKNKTSINRFYYFPSKEEGFIIKQVGTEIKKFDKSGRLILKKEKHSSSKSPNSRTKYKYNDLGLLISFKTKRDRAYPFNNGSRFYEPILCEYKNGVLNSFQFHSFYSLKRIE